MDLDSVLFKAAQVGEQIWYSATTSKGEVVCKFDSAKGYEKWLEEIDIFDVDTKFGYKGDVEDLTRTVDYEIKDVDDCYKSFDKIIKQWLKMSGCKDWIGYIGKATGMKNFRYDLSTLKGYKSGRGEMHKAVYLEDVRRYAANHPNVKIVRGTVEVDDVVCAIAQRKGYKACVVGVDKDARGSQNTHVFIPFEMEKPEFSSQRVIGSLSKNAAGKVVGLGTLFWFYQLLAGDTVDSITGCKGVGSVTAYNLLEPYSFTTADNIGYVVVEISKLYQAAYGDSYPYNHAVLNVPVVATWYDLLVEMSHLVYMKKSQKDECFWIPLISKPEIKVPPS
jgi:hypothetical protein